MSPAPFPPKDHTDVTSVFLPMLMGYTSTLSRPGWEYAPVPSLQTNMWPWQLTELAEMQERRSCGLQNTAWKRLHFTLPRNKKQASVYPLLAHTHWVCSVSSSTLTSPLVQGLISYDCLCLECSNCIHHSSWCESGRVWGLKNEAG